MDNTCLICKQLFTERSHFWKNHKIKEKDYYEKYLPKQDLFSKEKIIFKNPEQYELADFNDRRNLKKYLESVSKEDGLHYLRGWLTRRKESKNLIFAPGQFEIGSLIFPSIDYINKNYEDRAYQKICLNIGLELIYKYDYDPKINSINELKILCDTREQEILNFKNKQIIKLDFGDYTIENSNIFIERKSLNDFVGTISQGYKRFKNEIERCKTKDKYLVILVEEKYSNLKSFEYLPHMRHTKAKSDFIFHRIRELIKLYSPYIQFIAVDGRKEAARIIENILKLGEVIKWRDLQYYYNKGIL